MREGWGGMRARLARPDEGVGQRVHQLRAAMINRPRSTSCGALHRRAGEGTRPYMVCANDWAPRIHETRRMTKVNKRTPNRLFSEDDEQSRNVCNGSPTLSRSLERSFQSSRKRARMTRN